MKASASERGADRLGCLFWAAVVYPVFAVTVANRFWTHFTWHYREDGGIETAESKVARENFNEALEFLSTEKINEIYLLAIALSAEAERAAFICGVKPGVQLAMEME